MATVQPLDWSWSTFRDGPTVRMQRRQHLVNGLLLNPSKTKALVTGTRSQVAEFDSTAGIHLVDTTVEVSTAIRVLGIIIDRHLTFDDHITKVVMQLVQLPHTKLASYSSPYLIATLQIPSHAQ